MNFDATDCNQKKLRPRTGRSLQGQRCIIKEYLTTFGGNGKDRRNVLALLGYEGFVAWENRPGTTDSSAVADFFEHMVAPVFDVEENFLLFDNASVNVEQTALAKIDAVTAQRWKRLPPYSPRTAPIERAFALVWCEIRKNWQEAVVNPDAAIDKAFAMYAVGSPGGLVVKNLWNSYLRNHMEFLAV